MKALRKVGFWILVVAILVYTLFPFYWAVNGSFQPETHIFASPAHYLPSPPTLQWYDKVLHKAEFTRALLNSALVAGSVTLISLAIGSLAACALGRYRMRGKGALMALILSMTMFPQISILGAVRRMLEFMGLYNTIPGLALSYMLCTLPFTVWVLTNFFRSLPRELEESAYVDGATPWQTFWRILLPLSVPGLATTGMLAFIAAWNEYLFALSFTVSSKRTVPVVIANYAGEGMHETPWGEIMAASVLVTVPLIVLVLIFQRKIIAGMTAGAVKG